MELLAPRFLAFYALVASAIAVHRRGRVRFSFRRQLTDYSTFTAPYNVFVYLRSAMPNEPYLPLSAFPELDTLRRSWKTIREEARALDAASHIRRSDGHDDVYGNALFKKGWKRFYLKWYGDFLPSARRLCPQTVALLEALPSVHSAMFSYVAPRSRLGQHRDPLAASLRYHLGLITPNSEACRLYVDGVPYAWKDGASVLFDETYVHWVENDTDKGRIVLFCDVERPMRDRVATAINRAVIRHVIPITAARNEPGEYLGALNRLVAWVYPLHLAGRRLKERNRFLYYCLKFGGLAGVVYATLFGIG
jgi:beta-hydroxylase